jgi:hypothetical protein
MQFHSNNADSQTVRCNIVVLAHALNLLHPVVIVAIGASHNEIQPPTDKLNDSHSANSDAPPGPHPRTYTHQVYVILCHIVSHYCIACCCSDI